MPTNSNNDYVSYRLTINTSKKKGNAINRILESFDRKDRQTFMLLAVDMLCKAINYEIPEDMFEVYERVCSEGKGISPTPTPTSINTASLSQTKDVSLMSQTPTVVENNVRDVTQIDNDISNFIMGTLEDFGDDDE